MALSRRKFLLRYRTKVVDTFVGTSVSCVERPNQTPRALKGSEAKSETIPKFFSAKWQRNASIIKKDQQCWKQQQQQELLLLLPSSSAIKTITRLLTAARSRSTTQATWNVMILWQPKWRTLMVFVGCWRPPITGVKCRCCCELVSWWHGKSLAFLSDSLWPFGLDLEADGRGQIGWKC